ncbi:hypothetical protein COI_0202 [Mannheimia haemolytica serotype A2 str. OVINE]|nr:hypothetical protein COI_0202 [Mannheimia haemolytica serotype A2 str. OVINE]
MWIYPGLMVWRFKTIEIFLNYCHHFPVFRVCELISFIAINIFYLFGIIR